VVKRFRAAALLTTVFLIAASSAAQAEQAASAAPQSCDSEHFRIVLDVGHTAIVHGQISVRGVPEFEFNKNLADIVLQALHKADFPLAEMRIQQSNDLFLRARDLSSLHPDIILSLHHDGIQDRYLTHGMIDGVYREYSDRFAGYSLFVSYENPDRDNSILFARLLGEELTSRHHKLNMEHAEKIPGENRPVVDGNLGIFRYDKLVVLRGVSVAAVLMESAVIINPDDELLALRPDYQNEIAQSVVAAVTRYCALRARPGAATQPKPSGEVPPAEAPAAQQSRPEDPPAREPDLTDQDQKR
jgi:N-acetylmuramoyl-L-alanine amidase